jgi:hypothetical protein
MNLKFQLFPTVAPTELQNLSNSLPASSQRIPELDHIFEKIAQGQGNSLSALECLWCVLKKEEWDQERSLNEVNSTSKQLWIEAVNNELLRYYLLRGYLRYFLENQLFVTSLIDSFNTFKNNLSDHECIADLIDAVAEINLPSRIMYSVVTKCCQWNLGKHELLKILWENTGINTVDLDGFTITVAKFFDISSHNSNFKHDIDKVSLDNWLVKCLNQESDISNKQANAVEDILIGVRKEEASQYPSFIDWLKFHYQKGDRAKYLSESARRKLNDLIGAINFSDFAKLIKLVAESLPKMHGRKTNFQINQLFRRSYFWQNYSDKFAQVRIFIPSTSERIVSDGLYNQYTVLKMDYRSEPTEICVFDFNSCLIVEFFRGKNSEVRLFPCGRYPNIRQILFEKNDFSINEIRQLDGEVHDHIILWQSSCERWLYKHGISPNSGLSMFKVGENQQYPYNSAHGIDSNPPFDKLEEREERLEDWKPPSF